jgi:hypothetical protein
MTQDEIDDLARQARNIWSESKTTEGMSFFLNTFAKLVAAKERDRMCKQCNWSKHENATCNEANQPKILGES